MYALLNRVLQKELSDRRHLSRDFEIVNHMHMREECSGQRKQQVEGSLSWSREPGEGY